MSASWIAAPRPNVAPVGISAEPGLDLAQAEMIRSELAQGRPGGGGIGLGQLDQRLQPGPDPVFGRRLLGGGDRPLNNLFVQPPFFQQGGSRTLSHVGTSS